MESLKSGISMFSPSGGELATLETPPFWSEPTRKRKLMIRNNALLNGLVFLVTITAVPLVAHAGTWQPLVHQPPMPDIIDPDTGAFVSEGGAAFPILLTDGSVIVQNVNSLQFHFDGRVLKLTP
jgi:hypothetical protein